MRKFIIGFLLGVVVVGSVTFASAASSTPQKVTSSTPVESQPKAPAELVGKVRCRRLSCINRTLNLLLNEIYNCEAITPVTQYYGYFYDDGGGGYFDTTALDYTESGDLADDFMIVYVC